jgi:hypothetical protein
VVRNSVNTAVAISTKESAVVSCSEFSNSYRLLVLITCKCGSAKHNVEDDLLFLWEQALCEIYGFWFTILYLFVNGPSNKMGQPIWTPDGLNDAVWPKELPFGGLIVENL